MPKWVQEDVQSVLKGTLTLTGSPGTAPVRFGCAQVTRGPCADADSDSGAPAGPAPGMAAGRAAGHTCGRVAEDEAVGLSRSNGFVTRT